MTSRICVCCGEAMGAGGNSLSRNPNLCASCSSLVDGFEVIPMPEFCRTAEENVLSPARPVGATTPQKVGK